MIKSLFDEDENLEQKDKKATSETKADVDTSSQKTLSIAENVEPQADVDTENPQVETNDEEIETIEEIKTAIVSGSMFSEKNEEAAKIKPKSAIVKPFEIDKPIGQGRVEKPANEIRQASVVEEPVKSSRTTELEKQLQELEEELRQEKEYETQRLNKELVEKIERENEANVQQVQPLDELGEVETVVIPREEQAGWKDWEKEYAESAKNNNSITVQPKEFISESKAETARKMGMAWSAAIGLFGAVVIMLIIGWFVDLFIGSSPWGIVGGIVVGSIIGLVQFVRTTSQIVNPKPNDFDKVSLKSNIDQVAESKVAEMSVENVEKFGDNLEDQIENPIVDNNETYELESPVQETLTESENIGDEAETIAKIEDSM